MSDEDEVEVELFDNLDEVEDEEEDDEEDERFKALCAALRRNDPETTKITYFNLSKTYGRRLGEALQGNHYVSSMILHLGYMLDGDGEGADSIALLLRYIGENEAMREIELWAGGCPLELYATLVPPFLLAIAENPSIVELNLEGFTRKNSRNQLLFFCEQRSHSKH